MNFFLYLGIITILFLIYVEYSVGNIIYRVDSSGVRRIHIKNILRYLVEPFTNRFLWNIRLLDVNYIFILVISVIIYFNNNIF